MTRGVRALLSSALAMTVLLGVAACSDDAGTRVTADESLGSLPSESTTVVADIEPCPSSGPANGGEGALPDVELSCLGPGDPVLMSGLSGRPMVVNVWASWCAPCRAEMPWLQRLADSGAVAVLGVDAEDQSGAASALLAELGVTYPSVFDPTNSFARGIGVVSRPTSLLVSSDGEVVQIIPGAFESYEQLVESVETELGVKVR